MLHYLRGSFRPSNNIVELRSYVRQRSRLFEAGATQTQLMHKALTQMNIQLNHVISDITGTTGLNIIQAILKGTRSPEILANLSVGKCRKNIERIKKALEGNFRAEHVFALKQAYEGYEFFHKQIQKCEEAIEKALLLLEVEQPSSTKDESAFKSPSQKHRRKTQSHRSSYSFNVSASIQKVTKCDLTTIPGIEGNTAMKILSEIGTDPTKWSSPKAFVSWLGLCPGNKVSGGKVLSSRTRPSDNRAAQALRMAAFSLHRSKTALGAFFRRMRCRLGAPKAITATAHKLARILYRMLVTGENYREIGENYYEQQHQARVLANLKKRAKEVGHDLVPITQ
ncbi:IS110 family transposase [Candidatus Neptunochlamydia vexilliferae]|uniref:Transposase IS116/IS110/IS902 C-terminal domain-containing protein n=1 Tax=Candidatus Neptunichlamydia vexilliferae TaxID=1651774 RepID=A0ABS0B3S8_9BACT|nr:IS110 family transposase [Candidatus Neptunochlamydia vexilliferae]MBF5060250.1 hypothetical protein [Candidatus Neptunochlamydia vexilliferae]